MSKHVSDHILARVQQATDIVSLVREVVPLKKSGSGLSGLCPFHKEKTPSFHVNPERQIFKCFGCGAGGDAFSFVMKLDGITFPEAIRLLAERAHIDLPDEEFHGGEPTERAKLFEVNAWAADLYHRWLFAEVGKPALEYLLQRGLKMETIKQFKIGFAPNSWEALQKLAPKKGYSTGLLIKSGLAASNEERGRVYDRFRNRVIFPIVDAQERVIGFGARCLDGSEPKYLNSPETPLFSKGRTLYGINRARAGFRETKQAIVVEGYMDVVMAHQYGINWTVAVLGTALGSEHVRALRRLVDEAVLLFDADNAGQSSANRSVDAFISEELPARVATLPDGLDPDEYVMKYGTEAFKEFLKSGVDCITYKLNRAMAGAPADGGAAGAAKTLDDVLATVALIGNPITQAMELRKVAERAGIPEWDVQQRMQALGASQNKRDDNQDSQALRQPRARDIELELLQAAMTYPQTILLIRQQLDLKHISDANVRVLLDRACALSAENGEFGASQLLLRTQEEPLRKIVEESIGMESVNINDPDGWCRELIDKLHSRAHRQHGRELHGKMSSESEPTAADLTARLNAMREAHRRQGTLYNKRFPSASQAETQ